MKGGGLGASGVTDIVPLRTLWILLRVFSEAFFVVLSWLFAE